MVHTDFPEIYFLPIFDTWKENCNITAGYHQHIFLPPKLSKMPFRRMNAFLSNFFLIKFCNFSNLKTFLIPAKNPHSMN